PIPCDSNTSHPDDTLRVVMAQLRKIEYGKDEGDGSAVPLQNTLEPKMTKIEPSKCGTCGRTVREKDGAIRIDGRTFHLTCFVCSQCKKSLRDCKVKPHI